jgi:predicted alpha/beta hydrolase
VSDPEVLRPAADVGEAHVTVPNHSSLAARLSLGVGLAFALAGALLQSWEAAALGLVVVTPSAFLGERMRGLIGIGFAAVTCLTALWVRGELW